MRTRPLGRTGIHVSPYTLGTMKFGRFGNPDHDECVRIVHRALDNGINLIDTADVYGGDGESEQIIGKALRGRRDDVVLATKFSGPMGPDPNRRGNSRRWTVSAVEASLRRLGVDHIDLYQVHHPDRHRYRGDSERPDRSPPLGQGASHRSFEPAILGNRCSPMGIRTPRTGSIPH